MNRKLIIKAVKTYNVILGTLSLLLAIVGSWTVIYDWNTKNIEGGWNLRFTVESSSYKPYVGETQTQKVFFA